MVKLLYKWVAVLDEDKHLAFGVKIGSAVKLLLAL
jgi:hypothetical protein